MCVYIALLFHWNYIIVMHSVCNNGSTLVMGKPEWKMQTESIVGIETDTGSVFCLSEEGLRLGSVIWTAQMVEWCNTHLHIHATHFQQGNMWFRAFNMWFESLLSCVHLGNRAGVKHWCMGVNSIADEWEGCRGHVALSPTSLSLSFVIWGFFKFIILFFTVEALHWMRKITAVVICPKSSNLKACFTSTTL